MRATPLSKLRLAPLALAALAGWLVVGAAAAGCKPDLGAPPSLVEGPRTLDLRATPAEAKPGAALSLDALVVDPTGTDAPAVAWTVCRTPKPPAESNAVSTVCVAMPDDGAPTAAPQMITMPTDACSLFGPIAPAAGPGQPPIRPRDPDETGGFYQPVRGVVHELGGAPVDLIGFVLVRISCALANAPTDVAQQFNDRYHANNAPTLDTVTATDAAGVASTVLGPPAATPPSVRAREAVALHAAWTADEAETYPVFDVTTRQLVDTREALRVSWFTTGGELLHDRTGRASDDVATSTDNTWTAPMVDAPTTVHLWVVLRDDRGGSSFAGFDINVAP